MSDWSSDVCSSDVRRDPPRRNQCGGLTMLHIFEGGGRLAEDAVLAAMFEARKRVFVDLLGWDVPVLAGRFEVDQFDDVHARYLVLTDRQGSHLGSARLLDTRRPHILRSEE